MSVAALGADSSATDCSTRTPKRTAKALARVVAARRRGMARGLFRHVAALGRVIGTLYAATPPPVDEPAGRDLWSLLRTLRAFRALDKPDAYRLLRWGPMAVADLVGECFETRARCARQSRPTGSSARASARGRPAAAWCCCCAPPTRPSAPARAWFARGGPGAIAPALARAVRKSRRLTIRTSAPVRRVIVDGRSRARRRA